MATYIKEPAGESNPQGFDSFGNVVSMKDAYKYKQPTIDDLSDPYTVGETYTFKPVSETDPWFTSDFIAVKYTYGGEFFIRRNDGSVPTTVSETYVGPYYTWVMMPQYSAKRKVQYGTQGENVVGESFYGRGGNGKPKNQGLAPNAVLESTGTRIRDQVPGVQFEQVQLGAPSDLTPEYNNSANFLGPATAKGVHLESIAQPLPSKPSVIKIKQSADKKFVHIPLTTTVDRSADILIGTDSDLGEIAAGVNRYGIKGTSPIITNQPNFDVSIDDSVL